MVGSQCHPHVQHHCKKINRGWVQNPQQVSRWNQPLIAPGLIPCQWDIQAHLKVNHKLFMRIGAGFQIWLWVNSLCPSTPALPIQKMNRTPRRDVQPQSSDYPLAYGSGYQWPSATGSQAALSNSWKSRYAAAKRFLNRLWGWSMGVAVNMCLQWCTHTVYPNSSKVQYRFKNGSSNLGSTLEYTSGSRNRWQQYLEGGKQNTSKWIMNI